MAIRGNKLWLFVAAAGAIAAGVLSKQATAPLLSVLALLLSVVAIVLFAWPSKGSSRPANRTSRRSPKGEEVLAQRARRAEAERSAARAELPSYRPLVEGLSRSLGVDPETPWDDFSTAFRENGSIEDGLFAAFGQSPCFAWFDWKDSDGLTDFVERVREERYPDDPFTVGENVSVQVALERLDAWLRARGDRLLTIDIGSDSYLCLVLGQDEASALLRVRTPSGVSLVALDEERAGV